MEREILIIIEWEENARDSQDIIDEFTEEEMEEVNEPPKVNNPALEEGGDTAVAVTENGTNNGDA